VYSEQPSELDSQTFNYSKVSMGDSELFKTLDMDKTQNLQEVPIDDLLFG
jgi:hypothetical protein